MFRQLMSLQQMFHWHLYILELANGERSISGAAHKTLDECSRTLESGDS